MRYIPTDKYTVAWFKLAECVAKGEKEKAFGVYRLLMHSLEDKAYAHQLEGDLLGAFHDERALEKYEHAAQLYVTDQRWKEAIALYEELVSASGCEQRFVKKLLELYTQQTNHDARMLLENTLRYLMQDATGTKVQQFLVRLEELDAQWHAVAYEFIKRTAG